MALVLRNVQVSSSSFCFVEFSYKSLNHCIFACAVNNKWYVHSQIESVMWGKQLMIADNTWIKPSCSFISISKISWQTLAGKRSHGFMCVWGKWNNFFFCLNSEALIDWWSYLENDLFHCFNLYWEFHSTVFPPQSASSKPQSAANATYISTNDAKCVRSCIYIPCDFLSAAIFFLQVYLIAVLIIWSKNFCFNNKITREWYSVDA